MYPISQLNELARDPDFAQAVRSFADRLLAAASVRLTDIRLLQPLMAYGPSCPGTVIRLKFVPTKTVLTTDLRAEWASLTARLEAIQDA